MAENVYLYLKLNGTAVQGETSRKGLENSIECFSWAWGVEKSAGGRPAMGEIRFVQRIEKSTPLLYKGLVNNEAAEGVFKFFRPDPTGTGSTQQFFTVEGRSGRLTSISEWLPDTLNPATASMPPLLQVTLLFDRVKNTYEDGGIEFEWDSGGGSGGAAP